jgi:hypothetical protein
MRRHTLFIAALLLLLVGFWGGYTFATYRTAHVHLPVAQRFAGLHMGSLMLRGAELADRGETELLRRKLLAVARSRLEPLPYVVPDLWTIAASPLFLEDQSLNLRSLSDDEAEELTLKLQRLERTTGTAKRTTDYDGS